MVKTSKEVAERVKLVINKLINIVDAVMEKKKQKTKTDAVVYEVHFAILIIVVYILLMNKIF